MKTHTKEKKPFWITIHGWMYCDSRLKGIERDIFAYIYGWGEEGTYIDYQTLSEMLRRPVPSIYNSVSALEKKKMIRKDNRNVKKDEPKFYAVSQQNETYLIPLLDQSHKKMRPVSQQNETDASVAADNTNRLDKGLEKDALKISEKPAALGYTGSSGSLKETKPTITASKETTIITTNGSGLDKLDSAEKPASLGNTGNSINLKETTITTTNGSGLDGMIAELSASFAGRVIEINPTPQLMKNNAAELKETGRATPPTDTFNETARRAANLTTERDTDGEPIDSSKWVYGHTPKGILKKLYRQKGMYVS